MSKQPIFDRNTHERQKTLLAAEERRLQAKTEWKLFGLLGVLLISGVLVVAGAISLVLGLFR
ncbi:hypothetical protein D3C86_945490 [compost metagenome]